MKDLSQKILELYYDQEKPVEITMTDGTVLTGKLVSFYEGDEDQITGWHFVAQNDIEKYTELKAIDGGSEFGTIIKQETIKSIRFK